MEVYDERKTMGHVSTFFAIGGFYHPGRGAYCPYYHLAVEKDGTEIDTHGKVVVNWIISAVIYGVACLLLTFMFIGIPLLYVLAALCIIFPIIGGIKANNGELWKYPLSIQILK